MPNKILIGVPSIDMVYPQSDDSIMNLDTDGLDTVFHRSIGYGIAQNRNKLADYALTKNCTHILYIDNDVVIPKDALKNLLEHDREAVFGYYARRSKKGIYEGQVSVYKTGESSYTKKFLDTELRDLRESGEYLVRIHGGGMGCALIKTSVLKNMDFPYFRYIEYSGPRRNVLGEDLYFCNQLKDNGIPIYVDTRVGCGHIFRYIQEVI